MRIEVKMKLLNFLNMTMWMLSWCTLRSGFEILSMVLYLKESVKRGRPH